MSSTPPSDTPPNIVNLNRFRKAKARSDKRVQADENAVKFGRTKAQKALEEAQKTKAEATLEAHKRDDTP
ncbi:DUF4169 family protein [Celeribacter halophilus]|uniref:DUF4169 domain-containing protein n=1 Tax=Celeribacter halophilus TaxID=576117 RepID=A0A1I3TEE6_9RHOB|nr:DUF4169 family protein [Celeribacter halophilus]PZX11166.1 uncharacterized protein DUF4169 [Celeribacter halophilus]SFJ67837.1 protein of unknown function [Celeribacter halophilus]